MQDDSPSTERADMETQNVRVYKSSFRSERDTFYSDWTMAFWREFFQNSVDAGAKNIAISISTRTLTRTSLASSSTTTGRA
jgi:hypothetical protein